MPSLMDVCRNWGDEGCHPDIIKWRYCQEVKEGEEIPIRPVGKELKKLCKNGFAHHVAATLNKVGDIVCEALTTYLGWDIDYHTGNL